MACESKRIVNTEIVGVWSVEALYSMGGQSDEILVLNQNRTGWLEVINYHQWSADFFEWTPSSSGWFFFDWIKHIEPHKYTRKIIESSSVFQVVHTSAHVKEEDAPSGIKTKILHIQLLDNGYEAYGLVSSDPKTRIEPTGKMIELP